ncbi:MAG: DUF2153 family protein [Thermoprotei archaeon]|nr:DUF2153 family protein [Thermoprotei archaeon]
MSQTRDVTEFVRSLERWVALQKVVLENFKQMDVKVRDSDRLDIIIHTRLAFNHMVRTLKAFDDWLQDPFISSNIPRELLLEVWSTSLKILEALLELDIKHTGEVRNLIEKAVKEGRVSPVIAQLRDLAAPRGEERERRGPTISI